MTLTWNPLWLGPTILMQPRSVLPKKKKFYKIYFQIGDPSVEKKAPDGESVEKDSSKEREKRKVAWTAACCGNDGQKKTRQPSALDTLRMLEWAGSRSFYPSFMT